MTLSQLLIFARWLFGPEGSNLILAALCFAGLLGAPARLCLALTMAVHLVLLLS